MPSRLVNLQKTLAWSDFGKPRSSTAPAPGVVAVAAQMRVTHRHTINGEAVPGSKPTRARLKDDVVVEIVLQPAQIFVNDWVMQQPQAFQDAVLHHEQGHYDMVALLCRDMFIELMALKTQTFANGREMNAAIDKVLQSHDALIKAVHTPYDNATKHGRDSAQQQQWDGFFRTAFTQSRSPAETAPDGTPYRVRLDTVLRGAGISL